MCRLLRDAEVLKAKLGKIDGGEELGAHMINIVKAKQVVSRPKANTSPPSGEDTPA
jgi:vacuolar protein sorting-associated protein 54